MLTVAISWLTIMPNGFCTIDTDINNLDLQRNELLKRIIAGLTSGKLSITDAQRLKNELDNIVQLESTAKEDAISSPEHVKQISEAVQNTSKDIDKAIQPTKVWLGINADDKTIEQKITNALASKAISKEQAENFKQQFDELRARESNGDPAHGYEFEDAMSLAVDIQTLDNNIDRAIAGK